MASAVKVALMAMSKFHYMEGSIASSEDCNSLQQLRQEGLVAAARGFVAALQLFLREVLLARGHPPEIPAHVLDAAAAIAVKLVLGLRHCSRAGGERARIGGVDILQVKVQGGWHGFPWGARLGEHDDGTADAHLGVADAAVGLEQAGVLPRAESGFQEVDQLFGALDDEVRRDGMIPLWDSFDWIAHGDIITHLEAGGPDRFPTKSRYSSQKTSALRILSARSK